MTTIRIKNTGKETIQTQDWLTPLSISLSDKANIAYARVSTTPSSLVAKLTYNQDSFQIEPLVLNSEDTLVVTLIRVGARLSKIENRTRIAGIHDVTVKDSAKDMLANESSYAFIFFVIVFVLIIGFMVATSFRFFLVSIGLRAGRWTVLLVFTLTLIAQVVVIVWMYTYVTDLSQALADVIYNGTFFKAVNP